MTSTTAGVASGTAVSKPVEPLSDAPASPSEVPKIAITTPVVGEPEDDIIRVVSPTVYLPEMSATPRVSASSLSGGSSIAEVAAAGLAPAPPSPNAKRTGYAFSKNRPPLVGIPREQTFKRQLSERRENLSEVSQTNAEKRTLSADRRRTLSRASSRAMSSSEFPRSSAPSVVGQQSKSMTSQGQANGSQQLLSDSIPIASIDDVLQGTNKSSGKLTKAKLQNKSILSVAETEVSNAPSSPFVNSPRVRDGFLASPGTSTDQMHDDIDDDVMSVSSMVISEELETRWILNLSMTFRDGTPREKFFVTYLDNGFWRRVTISVDYRDYEEESLEDDLTKVQSQREKSRRIYIEVRGSLDRIKFFDTVTNLRLETRDQKLHIHVTQDVNEVINYPTTRQLQYLGCDFISSRDVKFDSHTSGFVYHVMVDGQVMIKKEIPGRESVDEFLYEVNALHSLRQSSDVIDFIGLVYDDENPEYADLDYKPVTGLLIAYASKGALVDVIYDHQIDRVGLPLDLRLKWARQIVQGLSDIHEAGFVQGDFTLANIVIDDYDDAKIIDINRRGCPVGWEPPEATAIIRTKQRLNMYIGVKSDIFQLGMVLWGLAVQEDEPERYERPLELNDNNTDVPEWYRDIVTLCLSHNPKNRLQASTLLSLFPRNDIDLRIPLIRTVSPPENQAYEHSDLIDSDANSDYDDEDDNRRGRSPMDFGHPTERNPLVWTSPPSLASSEIGDPEESGTSSTPSARTNMLLSSTLKFLAKDDFDPDLSVFADIDAEPPRRVHSGAVAQEASFVHEDTDSDHTAAYDISAVAEPFVGSPDPDSMSDKENAHAGPMLDKLLVDSGVEFEAHEPRGRPTTLAPPSTILGNRRDPSAPRSLSPINTAAISSRILDIAGYRMNHVSASDLDAIHGSRPASSVYSQASQGNCSREQSQVRTRSDAENKELLMGMLTAQLKDDSSKLTIEEEESLTNRLVRTQI
ncbi:hypothetical protein TD95_003096 [Thielaviopsis punctulata]|uniref:Protein kinase domain-containing protein n=1 Tax=Thielaviopsis punctulata TaxID=72032 RepID=A0A0F4ZH02_9PEZI|nr:hypothetical protein TD95_003096 [Thielaviopsis punctulata]